MVVLQGVGPIIFGVLHLPIRPCQERPPAIYGHFCLVPRVSVNDRYYCMSICRCAMIGQLPCRGTCLEPRLSFMAGTTVCVSVRRVMLWSTVSVAYLTVDPLSVGGAVWPADVHASLPGSLGQGGCHLQLQDGKEDEGCSSRSNARQRHGGGASYNQNPSTLQ